jgi:hypothetical protein
MTQEHITTQGHVFSRVAKIFCALKLDIYKTRYKFP